jgi:hypothetical protein
MADSAERQLKILLKLAADVTDSTKVTAALKDIETQADATAAAVRKVTITDASGATPAATVKNAAFAEQQAADQARLAALRAEGAATYDVAAAQNAVTSSAQAGLEVTQVSALAEARKTLEMERQVIVETQIEAAEARLAGDPTLALKLEREADIRTQALGIQRALNVSTEESIALAEELVLAQEATATTTGLMGVNLNKAKGEATVLAREIATGSVNARTLGAFLGSFGTTITLAAIAGFELYQVIAHCADEAVRLTTEISKETDDLVKQVGHWNELAAAAGDFGDVVKIGEDIQPKLDAISAKLTEFRNTELTNWQKFADLLPALTPFDAAGNATTDDANRQTLNSAISAQQELLAVTLRVGDANRDAAQTAVAAWEKLELGPVNDAIAKQSALVDEAKAKYASLGDELKTLLAGELDKTNIAQAVDLSAKLSQAGENVVLQTKRVDELTNSQTKLNTETDKLAGSIKKSNFDQLDPSDQLAVKATEIQNIQEQLQKLGVVASSPEAALAQLKSLNLTKDQITAVNALIAAWLKDDEAVIKANDDQAAAQRKAAQDALNASLREQQSLLQAIRQQQQLIAAQPFLGADAKEALTLASMSAELIQIGAAIEATKQNLLNSALDPAMHEKLQAQLQKDQFEFDLLKLKIAAINQPLSAELTSWVNSFGTSAHQIAGFIEGSINQALQSTNQLLLDAAFKTGDWRQTVMSLERSIADMFLTMLEKMALQQAASLLGISTTTSAQVASGAAITAAHAPAAAATSISSYGVAALIGEVAAIAAIVAIMAALGGGFKRGGYTGAGGEDEIAGPVHKGEFVFSKEATRNIGIENLAALHRAAPHFADGGDVEPTPIPGTGGGSPDPRIGPVPLPGVPTLNSDGRYVFQTPSGDVYIDPSNVTEIGGDYFYTRGYSDVPSVTITPGEDPGVGAGADANWDPTGASGSLFADAPPDAGGGAGALWDPSGAGGSLFADAPTGLPSGPGGIEAGGLFPGDPSGGGPASVTINPGDPAASGSAQFAGFSTVTGEPIYADAEGNLYDSAGVAWQDPEPFDVPSGTGVPWNFTGTDTPWQDPGASNLVTGIYGGPAGGGAQWTPPGPAGGDLQVDPVTGQYVDAGTPPAPVEYNPAGQFLTDDLNPARGSFSDSKNQGVGEQERDPIKFGMHPTGDAGRSVNSLGNFVMPDAAGNLLPFLPRRAGGGRMDGAPSNIDSILAWLAPGEHVIDAATTALLDRGYGSDWPQKLAQMVMPVGPPHFADGGRVVRR